MKKSLYPLLFCLLFSFACDEKEDPATACGVSDPINDLPWLLEMKESLSEGGMGDLFYIMQAKYKGKRVFYQGNCCAQCSTLLIFYDCGGNGINEEISYDDLEDSKVIWQPENSQCNL
ncbi:hypothetical protein SYJ56_06900 [Algoriphagus sp. D3-2-R+10]|uniref:hypothetical protein n=1 Tax=Algoriphagus aurantiacus TaxID=3103948 RepID=UPI002B3ADFCF|nr:hypothetical protein [Algoriphagus sp. D3-2-R+10]MEB2775027.1 hypothetical protein [Algoriphagus sp. D3-2-R+10]